MQRDHWALLGQGSPDGKIDTVRLILVTRDEDDPDNSERNFYTLGEDLSYELMAPSIPEMLQLLERIKKDILLHGIEYIKPHPKPNPEFGMVLDYHSLTPVRKASCSDLARFLNHRKQGFFLEGDRKLMVDDFTTEGMLKASTDYGDHEADYGTLPGE